MFNKIISFSIQNKLIIGLMTLFLIISGLYSVKNLPIDAVPDITNNQVQIITVSPSLAPQEIEQFITYPVEIAMSNLPYTEEIRSISRYGLSVVTVVFKEDLPILQARQYVTEQITQAKGEIPENMGTPELMPITTGLGEIYQYILKVDPAYKDQYNLKDLRSIQDWIVKRQLSGTEGIIETSSFGGELKEYEVSIRPELLKNAHVTLEQVSEALSKNNENTGGSYLEKGSNAFYIRTQGLITSIADIENIVIKTHNDVPVLVKNIADVRFGNANRYGAMTANGNGEIVGGITLMYKGENTNNVIDNVKKRIIQVQKSLPEGITIEPFMDRSELVGRAINTVSNNLLEGALIVIFILVLLLGNFRAGLIVASVIPLSLLFAFCLMNIFGVSANLMSLGAVDFGLVLDGSIIVIEAALHQIFLKGNRKLTQKEFDKEIFISSSSIRKSAAFGEIIILIVYLPILALVGIEGKMFTPMAQTVSFAILGALLLSLTYVPMMTALCLKKDIVVKRTIADRIIDACYKIYKPLLNKTLQYSKTVLVATILIFGLSLFGFMKMGGEFIPTLEEGDLALQLSMKPGTSLTEVIKTTTKIEKVLLSEFPEVKKVISKIGAAEIPTDPMGIENGDVMIIMKPKSEWISAQNRAEMQTKMKLALNKIVGVNIEMTQPIQLRFNELISGSKADIAIKIFGEDLNELATKGQKAASLIQNINGVGDLNIEQVSGLPQLMIRFKRKAISKYGLNIADVNRMIKAAYAGEKASVIFEGERKFDLVVRLNKEDKKELRLDKLYIENPEGTMIPLSELAEVAINEGPNQISREDTKRRITLGVNVRDRDIESLVSEIDMILTKDLNLKPGYYINYGGNFENLKMAKERLGFAVPLALGLILLLLFFTFGKFKYALIIFTAVPLAAIGGIASLYLRDMPFSISAGIGFIALFGVAVLDGIVLISTFNNLKKDPENASQSILEIIKEGTKLRLRPVLVTSIVASFGFLPMALSNQAGAEVQKPLATVVIGGLVSATLLTLLVLPIIYYLVEKANLTKRKPSVILFILFCLGCSTTGFSQVSLTQEKAIQIALDNNISLQNLILNLEKVNFQKKNGYGLGNTSLEWGYGELNAPNINDNSWSINQNIGNLAQKSQTIKKAKAQINQIQSQITLVKREITKNVSLAFNEWSYQLSIIEIEKSKLEQLLKIEAHFKQMYNIGLSHGLEYTYIKNKVKEEHLAITQAEFASLEAKKNLKNLIAIEYDIVGQPIKIKNNLMDLNQLQINPVFETIFLHTTLISKINVKEKSKIWFPDITIGYNNQQIEQVNNNQSFQVGLNFGILNSQSKLKKQNAKIDLLQTQNRIEQNKIELNNQFNYLINAYTINHNQLQQYSPLQSYYMDGLLKSIKQGQIDIYAFIINFETYIQQKRNYNMQIKEQCDLMAKISYFTK